MKESGSSLLDEGAYDEFQFPILCLPKKEPMHLARGIEDIGICSRVALKNGFYRGLTIVDSGGREYVVKEAVKIGYAGPFWGLNIFLNQRFRVRLVFEKLEDSLELNGFKSRLIAHFMKERDFLNSGGNLGKMISCVKSASSFREIIENLTSDFYKKY